jgi:hypothetical protein
MRRESIRYKITILFTLRVESRAILKEPEMPHMHTDDVMTQQWGSFQRIISPRRRSLGERAEEQGVTLFNDLSSPLSCELIITT